MNVIKKSKFWYIVSLFFMITGFLGIVAGGLKFGMDFTGGSLLEIQGIDDISKIEDTLKDDGFEVISVQKSNDNIKIRTGTIDENGHKEIISSLNKISEKGDIKEIQFSTIGATVSRDITTKAYMAITLGLITVILYVAYSFRKSSRHFASWKYGVCAVLAVFHDVIFVVGSFAILGMFLGIEIDSLFVTALLTVISFSVHDTIVIFDRIRENLKKSEESFSEVVNKSLVEMFARSINTSLVIMLVIFSLLVLGGESIRYFMLALFLGMLIGTYSSVFVAGPLLVTWKNMDEKKESKA